MLLNMSKIAHHLGNYSKAEEYYSAIIEVGGILHKIPNYAYYFLAKMYYYQGKMEEAIKCLQEGLKWTQAAGISGEVAAMYQKELNNVSNSDCKGVYIYIYIYIGRDGTLEGSKFRESQKHDIDNIMLNNLFLTLQ